MHPPQPRGFIRKTPLFFAYMVLGEHYDGHKIINCPIVTKLSKRTLEDRSERPKVTCPERGSQRNYRNGKHDGKTRT
jgi:hypothetical protein